jgi:hypothetical protein
MKVGTKSVLWGAHQFLIHPLFVAASWWRLFGFPWDPRLWVSFYVHDLGYWGRESMDNAEGEKHVEFGAKVVHWLFDRGLKITVETSTTLSARGGWSARTRWPVHKLSSYKWASFCLYHSRFYAKKDNQPVSKLCYADKLSICLEPWWLYLPRVWLSGELWEYMAKAGGMPGSKYSKEPETGKYESMDLVNNDPSLTTYQKVRHWHRRTVDYLSKWVEEHKDGRADTWTPEPVKEIA